MNGLQISLKKWSLYAIFLIAMTSGIPAYAVPTTSVIGNGIVWTLAGDPIPGVDTFGSFTLSVDVSGSTFGSTVYLAEFGLKNFGSTATISNLVATAGPWDWVNSGLNANGCKNKVEENYLCVFKDEVSFTPTPPDTTSNFAFSFDITLVDPFPAFTHLKVRWLDSTGKKVGDLISEDNVWAASVPEPSILALLGIGLAGLVSLRRLKKVS